MSKVHYWKLENIRAVRLKSDQDYADGLRERLDIAVRRNLRTHHKVGCFLSGGLDSSSVAALAAAVLAQQGKRLPAYTQVPDESFHRPPGVRLYYDERPYVEAIAKMIDNLDVTYVRSGEQDDFAELDPLFFAFDGPIRNVTNMGWIMKILRLAKAENHRVLLGGEYGNATISWTGWGQAVDHLVRGRLWTAVKQWRLLYRISSRSPVGAFRQLFIEPLSASPIVAWARRPDEAAIKAQFASDMRVVERAKRDARRIRAPLGSFALTERLEMIAGVPARGEWDAAAFALTGVECRDPTSDLDLLEYCFGIPDEQYLAEGIHRSLIRRAMWGRLPPKVLTNRRRGQQGADWFGKLSRNKERLASDVASLRSSKLAAEAIDIDRLDQLIQNLPETPTYKQTEALDYLVTVTRGVAAGRFLRLFEGKNR